MTMRPPAEIGMSLDEVDTPALVIDLDAFERNLRRLADRVHGRVRLRPHAKTHKCPVIALKQIELGAVGVCVQRVSEAKAMVYGGVRDVLVTNEVVGRQKRACRKLWRRPHDGLYRPQFHALLTCGRPKQSAGSRFCSHTVQAPARSKPFLNHTRASKPRIVRCAVWKD